MHGSRSLVYLGTVTFKMMLRFFAQLARLQTCWVEVICQCNLSQSKYGQTSSRIRNATTAVVAAHMGFSHAFCRIPSTATGRSWRKVLLPALSMTAKMIRRSDAQQAYSYLILRIEYRRNLAWVPFRLCEQLRAGLITSPFAFSTRRNHEFEIGPLFLDLRSINSLAVACEQRNSPAWASADFDFSPTLY